ncbi:MAG: hypothetical protein ABIG42_07035 [bacterium]
MIKRFKKLRYLQNTEGFSFLSILISVVIIGIMASFAIVQYKSLGLFHDNRTSPESFTRKLDKTLAMESLRKLHTMEVTYHIQNRRYGNFEELLQQGYITAGYTAKLQEHGVPYLEYWDIEMNALEDSYMLLAVPNSNSSEFLDVPILAMNETGRVWEEEGFEEIEDETEGDTSDEIPFPFGSNE